MREVVVTGGGTGIGYAIAATFVAAGDRVTITGRREQVLKEAAARLGVAYLPFDAAGPAAVRTRRAAFPQRVDVLVNNAGGNTDLRSAAVRRPRTWPGPLANRNANLLSACCHDRGGAAHSQGRADHHDRLDRRPCTAPARTARPRRRSRRGPPTWPPSSARGASPPTWSPPA